MLAGLGSHRERPRMPDPPILDAVLVDDPDESGPLVVACRTCHARPGHPCVRIRSGRARSPHNSRRLDTPL
jgi:hypothetical protein